MKIGEAIRATRQLKGLTLQQVGELIGSSKASLSKIELAKSITFKKLVQVAQAHNIAPPEIVKLTEPANQESRAITLLREIYSSPHVVGRVITDESLRDQIKDVLNVRDDDT